jgi:hypothetical protein
MKSTLLSDVVLMLLLGLAPAPADGQASIDSALVRRAAARWAAAHLLTEVRGGRVAFNTQTGSILPLREHTEVLQRLLGASDVITCGDATRTCAMKNFQAVVAISVDSLGEAGGLATVTLQRPRTVGSVPELVSYTLLLAKREDCWSFVRAVWQSAS